MCSPDTLQKIEQDAQDSPLKRLQGRFLSPSELLTKMMTFHTNAVGLVIPGSPEYEIHSKRAGEYERALGKVLE